MSSKLFSWFLIITLILTIIKNGSSVSPQVSYNTCNTTFTCGESIRQIGYPFRGTDVSPTCGHPGLVLECDRLHNLTTIRITNVTYYVLNIDLNDRKMRIRQQGTLDGTCLGRMYNTSLDFSLFDYTERRMNVTLLYGCPDHERPGMQFPLCGNTWDSVYVVEGNQGPGNCEASVILPVHSDENGIRELMNATRFGEVLISGIEIMWKFDSEACSHCVESSGRCGFDFQTNRTTCLCRDQPSVSETCPVGEERLQPSPQIEPSPVPAASGNASNRRGKQIGLSIAGAVLAGLGLGLVILYLKQRRKQIMAAKSVSKELTHSTSSTKGLLSSPPTTYTKSISSYSSSKSEFGRDVSYFGVQVFDLRQLQEATDNFNDSRELGDGGFGTVYYGELPDGCKIAVKRLYNNNFKRVEQFMNEVEILARLRHQNLVKLYGCTPKRSRELLLVYEYIPNGTVADHLHGNRAKSGPLSWPIRLNIAIETAQALIYLHKSDIIHRDVKTCNILLDNDFHVKVADFGLSRLFPTDVTHVSTAPQGTPGYVDPEYYQCYQLTEKSDVYSFGVVLIELISSLQAVDTNRHRHDINLSTMAMNKIQNHKLHELVDSSLGFGTNSSIRRMTTLVAELGFRCLQQERDMRPSMDDVLESLIRIENEDSDDHMIEIDIFGDEDDVVPLNSFDVCSSPD